MAGVKKASPGTGAASPVAPQRSPQGPDAEIDQIMSEIEELQQELSAEPAVNPPAAKRAAPAKLRAVPSPEAEPAAETEEPAVVEASVEDDLQEFRAGASDADLEATLGDLSDEGSGTGKSLLDDVIPEEVAENAAPEEPVAAVEEAADETQEEEEHEVPMSKTLKTPNSEAGEASEGSLTMTLSGRMSLKLKYECDGQEVTVGFSDECLVVSLADGTEFKVPVSRKTAQLKRVA